MTWWSSVTEAARKHRLTVAEVEDWQESFCWGRERAAGSATG